MLFRNWYYLYINQTKAERALEPAIAALGEPYRAQHLFSGLRHVADFVILGRKLIIEVDGASHQEAKQAAKDKLHTLQLGRMGYRVLRCTNEEALSDAKGTVTRLMVQALNLPPLDLAALEVEVRGLYHSGLLAPPKRRGRRPGKPPASAPGRPPKAAKGPPAAG
jgi:very-short-patch-repair endonuclease